jgi:hypothetical protein
MNEVWIYIDGLHKTILAFSSKKMLMQWAQEMNPEMKSLRLLPSAYEAGTRYTLLNHNTHLLPYSHRIYRLDLDTGENIPLWY